MPVSVGIVFALLTMLSIFMGMYTEMKFRESVAKRMNGLTFKCGKNIWTVYNVSDAKIFHLHTICIRYRNGNKKSWSMSLLTIEEALDLLRDRKLNRLP